MPCALQPARPHMSVACLVQPQAQDQLEAALTQSRLASASPRIVEQVTSESPVACLPAVLVSPCMAPEMPRKAPSASTIFLI